MSVQASIKKTVTMGGISFSQSSTLTADGLVVFQAILGAADVQEGQLTGRGSAYEGTVTLEDSGHGFEAGDRVNVAWDDGQRFYMEVTDVDGDEITIKNGGGDSLPDTLPTPTDVTVTKATSLDIDIQGTNIVAILLHTTQHGYFTFNTPLNEPTFTPEVNAGYAYDWSEGCGIENPVQHDVGSIGVAHSNASAGATMTIGILYQND